MSGIAGVYEPGRSSLASQVDRMIRRAALKDEKVELLSCASFSAGVAQQWPMTQLGSVPGVRVAVDADLSNCSELHSLVSASVDNAENLNVAELIAWAYKQNGLQFLEKLDGSFALSLWDESLNRLLLAVDPMGLKGLYWKKRAASLLFATRVQSILSEDQDVAVDPNAVIQFLLFSVVPAPLSIYKTVEKLSAGTMLLYQNGSVEQKRYWKPDYNEDNSRSEKAWADDVRHSIQRAVERSLKDCSSDSTGAYLSGGTDSSTVVAFMGQQHQRVKTFSIVFADPIYSEASFSQTAAQCFSTDHHESSLSATGAFDSVHKILDYYGEPFANSSAIGSYHCAKMAREAGVDTLLAGDGGDELFAGNQRYASDKKFSVYGELPGWIRNGVIKSVAGLLPSNASHLGLPRRYLRRASIPLPRRIYSYGFFADHNPLDIFEPDFLSLVTMSNWFQIANDHFNAVRATSDLNRLLYMDLNLTLADNDIRKVSGTAELAGVRVRYPFLDRSLVEMSAAIPSRLKLKGFTKRYIFKKAMKDILPKKILYKKKHGFGVPVSRWLLHDSQFNTLLNDVIRDSATLQRGYFRRSFLNGLQDWHSKKELGYFGEVLWYLLVLELWHRRNVSPEPEPARVR